MVGPTFRPKRPIRNAGRTASLEISRFGSTVSHAFVGNDIMTSVVSAFSFSIPNFCRLCSRIRASPSSSLPLRYRNGNSRLFSSVSMSESVESNSVPPTDDGGAKAEERAKEETADVLVQYVVLRRDLIDSWPLGSVVTQGCHASVSAIWLNKDDSHTSEYCSPGNIDSMHKVSQAFNSIFVFDFQVKHLEQCSMRSWLLSLYVDVPNIWFLGALFSRSDS